MDFGALRRRLVYPGKPTPEESNVDEEVLAASQTRAIEDGREVEDRITLPPLMDKGGMEGSTEASCQEPEGRLVRVKRRTEEARPATQEDPEAEEEREVRGEREVAQECLSTQTPARFSIATSSHSDQRSESAPLGGWEGGPAGLPRMLGPVLDPQDVRRMEELQSQSPLIYTRKAEEQLVQGMRPEFLEEERKKREEKELRRRVEDLAEENVKLRDMMKDVEKVFQENLEMKSQVHKMRIEKEVEKKEERQEERTVERLQFSTPEEPVPARRLEFERRQEGEKEERRERPSERQGSQPDAIQVMLALMQGMQEMQKRMLEKEEKGEEGLSLKGVEFVRGQPELPKLQEWAAGTAPIDLNDWLVLIEPIMADLTPTSQEWWEILLQESREWYDFHMKKTPLERLSHHPTPSPDLAKKKWVRLEKRASTMLLMGIPETQREELIATKSITAKGIICRLLTVYQPGGLAEKEVILRSLEAPVEAASLPEAVGALRKWMRWRNRARELGVSEPDASILLRGLGKIIKKPLELNRDLSFRVNLTRSMLQVDSTPSSTNVHQFATHLLAEMEVLAHTEGAKRGGAIKDQPKTMDPKMRKAEVEERGGRKDGGKEGIQPCRFFNTDTGCRKGKECRWSHVVEEGKRRCWVCGAVDHYAGSCTRPKESKGSPEKKGWGKGEGKSVQKAEVESSSKGSGGDTQSREGDSVKGEDSGEVMRGLLEEANKMLKGIQDSRSEDGGEKEGRLQKLQRQLDELKAIRVFRIASLSPGSGHGLLDSGATHSLRGKNQGDSLGEMQEVKVNLACGRDTMLRMTRGGTMVAPSPSTEPIVPLGKIVEELGCKVGWDSGGIIVTHPVRGKLEVFEKEGCPHVSQEMALELIEELEEKERRKIKAMKMDEEDREKEWIKELINVHPALKTLPDQVKRGLVVKPAKDLKTLPGLNRRGRKRAMKDGLMVHLYAGPKEGYTLARALKEVGSQENKILEVDVLRGSEHDLLQETPFNSLLRLALDGKLVGMVGGPNCRTRSVLRHYPVEGGPRPVRAWGGEEFGRRDLSSSEAKQVWEDDVLMWRMILLYVVAEHVGRANEEDKKGGEEPVVWFGMEQPANPTYKPEVVSIWETPQWKLLKKVYQFSTWTFNQGDWGAEAVKPTTWGGNLPLRTPTSRNPDAKARGDGSSRDSKGLSRWCHGMMREVARSIQQHVLKKEVTIKKLSWEEHLRNGHLPFRKDCRVCQEASAKSMPHRRVVGPRIGKARAGVLSVDTTGPLVKGKDVVGGVARFLLVGAFTWILPKDSKMKEEKFPDQEDEEAEEEEEVEIDIEEAEDVFDEEAERAEDEALKKKKRGRPRKLEPEEEKMEGFEELMKEVGKEGGEESKPPEESGEGGGEEDGSPEDQSEERGEGPPDDFEVKVFRMMIPMETKTGEEVLRGVAEMVTRLHLEGFQVQQIHSDHGGEFTSRALQKWTMNRGIARTFTGVSDPQSNGRVENSVQQVKSYLRRVLLQAKLPSTSWPLAARYLNEVMRYERLGLRRDFPPFWSEVLVKKRRWDTHQVEPRMEKVRYVSPSPWNYGHWVQKEDGNYVVSRFVITYTEAPVKEEVWIALEDQGRNPMEVRRRIRGKTSFKKMEADHTKIRRMGEATDPIREKEGETEDEEGGRPGNLRIMKVIEEEMTTIMGETDQTQMEVTLEVVAKLRRLVEENTDEEVLQTRIVGVSEVMMKKDEWRGPILDELTSLVEEKEALRPLRGKAKEEFFEKAAKEGRRIEVVPGKLVPTIKPGAGGGRKKARIVACGNFTNRDAQEELYASTGDAVILRVMMKLASENGWEGVSLDVKTAFLNAPWEDLDVLVRPPSVVVKMELVDSDTLWLPTKALYGFRKSPRLWGVHRDAILRSMKFNVQGKEFEVVQFTSEPNLWRVQEVEREDWSVQEKLPRALMMVYVDDVFAVGELELLQGAVKGIQGEWKTSEPEWVSEEPVRFLGMEIQRMEPEEEEKGRVWKASQVNYTKDLLRRNLGENEKRWPKRKIPMTRDTPGEIEKPPSPEEVREAQRVTGELLWLVTRTRPDLMFPIAKMSAKVLHNPVWVREAAQQVWGYLASTMEEGIIYQRSEELKPWEEGSGLQAFSDASFSPGGEESHGSVIITLRGGLLVWRSSKQSMVTLSTAEAELNEVIEGLMLGESVAAILEEMDQGLRKEMISDSQAAVSICLAEGGSWRTRHLRLRASHARQRFVKGDWVLRHCPGEEMLADIGTKPLAATRLNYLKGLIGMSGRRKEGENEGEKARSQDEPKKSEEIPQVEMMLKMVVLLASIGGVKAQGREEEMRGFLVVAAWVFCMVVIGMFAVASWMGRMVRGIMGKRGKREPEEEPTDTEDASQRGRSSARRRTNPEAPETPLPNPVPQPGRTGRPAFLPSQPAGTPEDGRPGSSGDGGLNFPPFPQFSGSPDGAPAPIQPPEEEPRTFLEDLQEGLRAQMHQASPERPVSYQGKGSPGSVHSSGSEHEKGKGKGRIKGKDLQEVIRLAVEDPDPVTRSYYECTLRNHGIDIEEMREARRNPDTPTTATMTPPRRGPYAGGNAPGVVYITKWGSKYHVARTCSSLTRSVIQESRWCPDCVSADPRPRRVFATGPGGVAHEDMTCPRLAAQRNAYMRCQICG